MPFVGMNYKYREVGLFQTQPGCIHNKAADARTKMYHCLFIYLNRIPSGKSGMHPMCLCQWQSHGSVDR